MSGRPLNWSPLAPSDPVPGDPGTLERGAEHYASVKSSMVSSVDALSDIEAMTDLVSDGVEALRDRAKEVRTDLDKTIERYGQASVALSTYASALRTAQNGADALLEEARAADQRHSTLVGDRNYWLRLHRNAEAQGDVENAALYQRRADNLLDDIEAAQRHVNRARDEELPAILAARDNAAEDAIGALQGAIDSGPKDGWWENWGADVFAIISQVASIVAAITGVLALVLCWVPILGQVLAAIATVATAVALIADLVLALTGEKGWGDVVMGVVALATLGIGRIATNAFRIASLARAGEGLASVATATQRVTAVAMRVDDVVINVGTRVTQATRTGPTGFAAFRQALSAEGGIGTLFQGAGIRSLAGETWQSLTQVRNLGGLQGTQQLIRTGWGDLLASPPSAMFARLFGQFDEADNLAIASSLRGADTARLAELGMAAPNSAAFAASVTLPSGAQFTASFATSFDGLMGSAPLATAGAAMTAVNLYNFHNDFASSAEFTSDVTNAGFDFYSWVTDSVDEHTAADRLNLH